MVIKFEKSYLEQIYKTGKAKGKKHRFHHSVIKKYIQTIDKLKAAENIEELYPIKSLNYEKLIGKKKGVESVRVNNKYRIEFTTTVNKSESDCITICSIIELSNHYK